MYPSAWTCEQAVQEFYLPKKRLYHNPRVCRGMATSHHVRVDAFAAMNIGRRWLRRFNYNIVFEDYNVCYNGKIGRKINISFIGRRGDSCHRQS